MLLNVIHPRSGVVRAEKNDVGQEHEAHFYVKHARRRLDHRLQVLVRPAQHHHRPRKLRQRPILTGVLFSRTLQSVGGRASPGVGQ